MIIMVQSLMSPSVGLFQFVFLRLMEETHASHDYVSMCVKTIETREHQYFLQSYVSKDLTSISHNLLKVLLSSNHSRD